MVAFASFLSLFFPDTYMEAIPLFSPRQLHDRRRIEKVKTTTENDGIRGYASILRTAAALTTTTTCHNRAALDTRPAGVFTSIDKE